MLSCFSLVEISISGKLLITLIKFKRGNSLFIHLLKKIFYIEYGQNLFWCRDQ